MKPTRQHSTSDEHDDCEDRDEDSLMLNKVLIHNDGIHFCWEKDVMFYKATNKVGCILWSEKKSIIARGGI